MGLSYHKSAPITPAPDSACTGPKSKTTGHAPTRTTRMRPRPSIHLYTQHTPTIKKLQRVTPSGMLRTHYEARHSLTQGEKRKEQRGSIAGFQGSRWIMQVGPRAHTHTHTHTHTDAPHPTQVRTVNKRGCGIQVPNVPTSRLLFMYTFSTHNR